MSIAIQCFHTKFATFQVLTSVYNIGVSTDSQNSPEIVSGTV